MDDIIAETIIQGMMNFMPKIKMWTSKCSYKKKRNQHTENEDINTSVEIDFAESFFVVVCYRY